MNNKKEFYKKVIDTHFEINSQKTTFNEPKGESELKEVLDLGNTKKQWNKNEQDFLLSVEY